MTAAPSMASSGAVRACRVQSFPMASPGDVSALREALHNGSVSAGAISCVLVKTEGNGLDNDFTRIMATDAIRALLAGYPEHDATEVSLIASGGCEGFTTPHMTVFEVLDTHVEGAMPSSPRLAMGRAVGNPMQPEWIGTLDQARCTAEAVRLAMDKAGLRIDEVAYVEVKAAMLTPEHQLDARARGVALKADSMHGSKTYSRAASALGIALALEELDESVLDDDMVGKRLDLFTPRGCVTAGDLELRSEVVVFGNSASWRGSTVVASGCLSDLLDMSAVARTLAAVGLAGAPQLSSADGARLRALIFKGEPSHDGLVRDERHVMWRDSDVHALRHMRAAMSGLFAGLTGHTRLFIGGGAEHQGPEGGGTLAIFADAP